MHQLFYETVSRYEAILKHINLECCYSKPRSVSQSAGAGTARLASDADEIYRSQTVSSGTSCQWFLASNICGIEFKNHLLFKCGSNYSTRALNKHANLLYT